jgi:hypothetical protein
VDYRGLSYEDIDKIAASLLYNMTNKMRQVQRRRLRACVEMVKPIGREEYPKGKAARDNVVAGQLGPRRVNGLMMIMMMIN